MIQLNLTPEEATMLGDVLESYLSDLRMETADIDAMDVRESLKEQEAMLRKLLPSLGRESAG